MLLNKEQIMEIMKNEKYPLTLKYDPEWIIENQMGSHCLWLQESLVQVMDIKPNMRILDLGCGKAISSIFLAKEFGVHVWANDLWISASENWERIRKAGVENLVYPIHAESHKLPYADNFFDAIVSINSIQFYGTDQLYLKNHLVKYVKSGGQIGIIVPGLYNEFDGNIPEYIKPYWENDFYTWHSPQWWSNHWGRTELVDIEIADTLPDNEGYEIFRKSEMMVNSEHKLVLADEGRNISFVRIIARKK
ncbi:MAG: hypothetical protein A2086_06205 [Spirochaetes bacterium GWD1_27_9]|nr:MAG: hypothetical protein A2Z98_16860 [Spirochaetes bacterium GWB1_27_13]OHD27847.1 MAG: hypothetical protein A2Y34_15600 [Spirochaetes bacterium GWC1_27_15]OHD30859.1 MAG: hypothetical protein A2086_06205 [Spirochaetes bacterium GWD1_27_9]